MAEIADISLYRQDCNNCHWHGRECCQKPGGWHWDTGFNRCVDFEWSGAAKEALRKARERE